MGRRRLGVIATLPEPLAVHVQAWRRALRDPTAERIGPHLTLAPPQAVAEDDVPAARALVERAAAEAVPCVVELDGAAKAQAIARANLALARERMGFLARAAPQG